ncbi:hypothetical protein NP493_1448g00023 [Ridgeia piscesae]|uniref:Uncharacterized protein n=1 Tax=Ridgeia piscesae TaxID=27915 RepID=A0AAD9NB62_RIDPI|nr:hypothetical protein NP493_1448g00023 [Ridgeia piscesae]
MEQPQPRVPHHPEALAGTSQRQGRACRTR